MIKIGKHCIIAEDTEIGDGTIIMNYVEIREGVKIGKNCYIDSRVTFTGNATVEDGVTIRNNCVIARGCYIGENTFISPQVMFQNLDTKKEKIGGARIGFDCFIGTNVTFKEGIIVGDKVVIGSKSYVNKNLLEEGTYIGTKKI